MPIASAHNPRRSTPTVEPRRVVIAGGGVGALEALLALNDLGQRKFQLIVIAPNERFELRALSVAQPFAAGHHADVAALADVIAEQGATLVHSVVVEVDADHQTVKCTEGEQLTYDDLILSPGARPRVAYESALTFGLGDPLALNGLLRDLEDGYEGSVAFVVPDGVAWSLPLYELAIMTARQVRSMGQDVDLRLATPEVAPLAVFGPEASAAVAAMLAELDIAVHCGLPVTVGRGSIRMGTEEAIAVDRIVSLPVLDGPYLNGVPANAAGFITVDEFCRVPGLPGVYAIGDATDLAVKQGGIACQQAGVAARHIAHAAGGPLPAIPFAPVLRGRLLTGHADRFLRRDLQGAHGEADEQALWWPPTKVYGEYLGPWFARRGGGPLTADLTPAIPPEGIDVEIPLARGLYGPRNLLGLDSLGPTGAPIAAH
jgi:sulfide:quinone oxidoreductase